MAKRRTAAAIGSLTVLAAAVVASGVIFSRDDPHAGGSTGMAVEFMDHAASAYVAQYKGWYEDQGLNLSSYTSYVTGMALASALARNDIQVAYMCLVPAINAYANAGVPIKIVAGTHKYGYALVADPHVVGRVEHLLREGVRIGCVREGGTVDFLMNRAMEAHRLDRERMLSKVRRMSPPKLLMAIKNGQLDAAFLPEQWAGMAEDLGFTMLLTAQDVWPGMQGSVVVVKEGLIRESPETVRKLVAVNEAATRWINDHPEEAAGILAEALSLTGNALPPSGVSALTAELEMSPETILRSMSRLEYSTAISPKDVQEVIDYAAGLGYIDEPFPAEEILDMRFMR